MTDLRRLLVRFLLAFAALLPLGCGRKPASLDVSPRKVVLYGIGNGKELKVRVLDGRGADISDNFTVTFKVSPDGIAEASASGYVKAKKEGRATVTVEAGPISASVPVEVRDISSLDIVPAALRMIGPAGMRSRLEIAAKNAAGAAVPVANVAWTSKDPKVAAVSPDGVVTSVQEGKTTVTAKLGDLASESDVEVQIKTISRLEIRPETAIVKVGESEKFSVLAYDESGLLIPDAAAQFSSPNGNLVKVSGDGKATGIAKGTASVVATIGNKSAQATLLVD